MSDKLINERPLLVLPKLVRLVGSVDKAIILQQVHFVCNQPRSGEVIDGETWVYNTYDEWIEFYFTFWTAGSLRRHINKLEKDGWLLSCQPYLYKGDARKYYRVNSEKIENELMPPQIDEANPSVQSARMGVQSDQMGCTKCAHGCTKCADHNIEQRLHTKTSSKTSGKEGGDRIVPSDPVESQDSNVPPKTTVLEDTEPTVPESTGDPLMDAAARKFNRSRQGKATDSRSIVLEERIANAAKLGIEAEDFINMVNFILDKRNEKAIVDAGGFSADRLLTSAKDFVLEFYNLPGNEKFMGVRGLADVWQNFTDVTRFNDPSYTQLLKHSQTMHNQKDNQNGQSNDHTGSGSNLAGYEAATDRIVKGFRHEDSMF